MSLVNMQDTNEKEFWAFFERKVQYPVRVTVKEGVEVLLKDGKPYVLIKEPPFPNSTAMTMLISLQEAVARGLATKVDL